MAMNLTLNDAAHWVGIDDFSAVSADSEDWSHPVAMSTSWGGTLPVGASGLITTYDASGLDTETDLFASTPSTSTVTDVALYRGATALWEMHGAIEMDNAFIGAGVNDAVLLAGNDQITGNAWNNKLEGFGGDDFIEGGGGTDTAVFSGAMAAYTFAVDGTLIHTSGPDGYDTLAGIERLQFDDYGIAFDVNGTAGEAYRLYQAAFDRAPDLGGLGFQMAALDDGLTLSQVAGNFIASPEFQAHYGTLSNRDFVTQLYANVLHRAPDAGGLAFHLQHLNAGMSRGDVLVGFSESPENQANVIGQIEYGMLYLPHA